MVGPTKYVTINKSSIRKIHQLTRNITVDATDRFKPVEPTDDIMRTR
jgi:hypothetical protein